MMTRKMKVADLDNQAKKKLLTILLKAFSNGKVEDINSTISLFTDASFKDIDDVKDYLIDASITYLASFPLFSEVLCDVFKNKELY